MSDEDAVSWKLPYDDPYFANYLFNNKICKVNGHRRTEDIQGIFPDAVHVLAYCHFCNHMFDRLLSPSELEGILDETRETDIVPYEPPSDDPECE